MVRVCFASCQPGILPKRVYKDCSPFSKGFMGSHVRRKGEWLASYASCRVVVPKPFNPPTLITQNPNPGRTRWT